MLDIDLSGVTGSDATARLIVRHMARRGARIVGSITTSHHDASSV
jgi:acyl-CoA reductase-like NAD-dependent aldehyde dehydrogenase